MDNFTGSFCDSGNYAFIENTNNSHIFDSKLPICLHVNNMDSLLNVKNDLIEYLDNDAFVVQDNTDSDILKNITNPKVIAQYKVNDDNSYSIENN